MWCAKTQQNCSRPGNVCRHVCWSIRFQWKDCSDMDPEPIVGCVARVCAAWCGLPATTCGVQTHRKLFPFRERMPSLFVDPFDFNLMNPSVTWIPQKFRLCRIRLCSLMWACGGVGGGRLRLSNGHVCMTRMDRETMSLLGFIFVYGIALWPKMGLSRTRSSEVCS